MTKWHFVILGVFFASPCWAVFSNYNGVLVGERAAGMGGAAIALVGDASSGAYYNPATLARLSGSSLSANVTLFNKYDATYGQQESLDTSLFRINQGAILPIPAASGLVSSFHNFTAAVSIVLPEYQNFGGIIDSTGGNSTFLRLQNQSVWVGGAFALNITNHDALGFTAYYTSQTYDRSLNSLYALGAGTTSDVEETTFTTNSIIYQLGYFHEFSKSWQVGAVARFLSIPVDSTGSYSNSSVSSGGAAPTPTQTVNLKARADVPEKLGMGVVYSTPHKQSYSLDVDWYGGNSFTDLEDYGDLIEQNPVVNFALGFENYIEPWLALRLGLFSDFASSPTVPENLNRRYQDHIDKYGFSANFGIKTTDHTTVDLGGYYLGGVGATSEFIDGSYQAIKKSEYLFSFLVGSSYVF
jgi:hypothetical protein